MGFLNQFIKPITGPSTPDSPVGDYFPNIDKDSAQKLVRDPRFLTDVVEFYKARDGKAFNTPEEALEHFFSDRAWANTNTVSIIKDGINAATSQADQSRRLARLEKVYDEFPDFWQDGGRGWGHFFTNLLPAATLDPLNALGGAGGKVAGRTAALAAREAALKAGEEVAGRTFMKEGAYAGAKAGAIQEGAINAGVNAGQDVLVQQRDKELGLQDNISATRALVAGAGGAAIGGGMGAAFGAAGGALGARNAAKVSDAVDAIKPPSVAKEAAEEGSTTPDAGDPNQVLRIQGAIERLRAQAEDLFTLDGQHKSDDAKRAFDTLVERIADLEQLQNWPNDRERMAGEIQKLQADGDMDGAREKQREFVANEIRWNRVTQAKTTAEMVAGARAGRSLIQPATDGAKSSGDAAGGAAATPASPKTEAESVANEAAAAKAEAEQAAQAEKLNIHELRDGKAPQVPDAANPGETKPDASPAFEREIDDAAKAEADAAAKEAARMEGLPLAQKAQETHGDLDQAKATLSSRKKRLNRRIATGDRVELAKEELAHVEKTLAEIAEVNKRRAADAVKNIAAEDTAGKTKTAEQPKVVAETPKTETEPTVVEAPRHPASSISAAIDHLISAGHDRAEFLPELRAELKGVKAAEREGAIQSFIDRKMSEAKADSMLSQLIEGAGDDFAYNVQVMTKLITDLPLDQGEKAQMISRYMVWVRENATDVLRDALSVLKEGGTPEQALELLQSRYGEEFLLILNEQIAKGTGGAFHSERKAIDWRNLPQDVRERINRTTENLMKKFDVMFPKAAAEVRAEHEFKLRTTLINETAYRGQSGTPNQLYGNGPRGAGGMGNPIVDNSKTKIVLVDEDGNQVSPTQAAAIQAAGGSVRTARAGEMISGRPLLNGYFEELPNGKRRFVPSLNIKTPSDKPQGVLKPSNSFGYTGKLPGRRKRAQERARREIKVNYERNKRAERIDTPDVEPRVVFAKVGEHAEKENLFGRNLRGETVAVQKDHVVAGRRGADEAVNQPLPPENPHVGHGKPEGDRVRNPKGEVLRPLVKTTTVKSADGWTLTANDSAWFNEADGQWYMRKDFIGLTPEEMRFEEVYEAFAKTGGKLDEPARATLANIAKRYGAEISPEEIDKAIKLVQAAQSGTAMEMTRRANVRETAAAIRRGDKKPAAKDVKTPAGKSAPHIVNFKGIEVDLANDFEFRATDKPHKTRIFFKGQHVGTLLKKGDSYKVWKPDDTTHEFGSHAQFEANITHLFEDEIRKAADAGTLTRATEQGDNLNFQVPTQDANSTKAPPKPKPGQAANWDMNGAQLNVPDGHVLAIMSKTDGRVRRESPSGISSGNRQSARDMLGKANADEWVIGYVPADADASARAFLFRPLGEAADSAPVEKPGQIKQAPVDVSNKTTMPRYDDLKNIPITPDMLPARVDKRISNAEDLYIKTMNLERLDSWLLPTRAELDEHIETLIAHYQALAKVAPNGIKLDNATRQRAFFALAGKEKGLLGKHDQRTIAIAVDFLRRLGGDENVAPIYERDTSGKDRNGGYYVYGPNANRIVLNPKELTPKDIKNKVAPTALQPDVETLFHETAHWAYQNILTPEDRITFWQHFRKYELADGTLDHDGILARLPDTEATRAGLVSGNSAKNLQEYFANQFSMYAMGRMEPQVIEGLWRKVAKVIESLIRKFFDMEDGVSKLVDPELIPLFEKILPEEIAERRFIKATPAEPPTSDHGSLAYRVVHQLDDLRVRLEHALDQGFSQALEVELQRETNGTNVSSQLYALFDKKLDPKADAESPRIRLLDGRDDRNVTYLNATRGYAARVIQDFRTKIMKAAKADADEGAFDADGILAGEYGDHGQFATGDEVEIYYATLSRLANNLLVNINNVQTSLDKYLIQPEIGFSLADGSVYTPRTKDPAKEAEQRAARQKAERDRKRDARVKAATEARAQAQVNEPRQVAYRNKATGEVVVAKDFNDQMLGDWEVGTTRDKLMSRSPKAKKHFIADSGASNMERSLPDAEAQSTRTMSQEDAYDRYRKTGSRDLAHAVTHITNTELPDGVDPRLVTDMSVMRAVSREAVDAVGDSAHESIPARAPADVAEALLLMTHRDAGAQHSMRTIAYRLLNLLEREGDITEGDVARMLGKEVHDPDALLSVKGETFKDFRAQLRRIAVALKDGNIEALSKMVEGSDRLAYVVNGLIDSKEVRARLGDVTNVGDLFAPARSSDGASAALRLATAVEESAQAERVNGSLMEKTPDDFMGVSQMVRRAAPGTPSPLVAVARKIFRKEPVGATEMKTAAKFGGLLQLSTNSARLIKDGAKMLANWISPVNGTGYHEAHASELAKRIHTAFRMLDELPDAKGKLGRYARKLKFLGEIAQPESHKRIALALRRGEYGHLAPEERKVAEHIAGVLARELKTMQDEGIIVGDVLKKAGIKGYLPQVWSEDALRDNYDKALTKFAKFFHNESRRTEGMSPISEAEAHAKAEKLINKMIDDRGVVLPSGAGYSDAIGDHFFQRVLTFTKKDLDELGLEEFMVNDLQGLLAKYFDASTRRRLFHQKWGIGNHGYEAYKNIAMSGRQGAVDLLTNPKTKTVYSKIPTEKGAEELGTEITLITPLTKDLDAAQKIVARVEEMLRHDDGVAEAKQFLLDQHPVYSKAGVDPRQLAEYKKRVDAVVEGLNDFGGEGAAIASSELKFMDAVFDSMQGKPGDTGPYYQVANKTSKILRNFNSVTLLGFATLTSIPDYVLPLLRSGSMKSWLKGMAEYYAGDASYRDAAARIGVGVENLLHEHLAGIHGSGGGRFANAFFVGNLLTPWTNMQRSIAALVAFESFKTEAERAQRLITDGKTNTRAYRRALRYLDHYGLGEFGREGAEVLDDIRNFADKDQIRHAILRFAGESIFTPNANDVPHWAHTPWGSLAFQLKSYPMMMGRLQKHIMSELRSGNPMPFAYLMTAAAGFGAVALALKDIVQLRGGEDEKSAAVRERSLSKLAKEFGWDVNIHGSADTFFGWYVESLLQASGLGLVGDIVYNSAARIDNGAWGQQRVAAQIFGPTVGTMFDVMKVAGGVVDGDESKNAPEREAARTLAGRVPVAGNTRAFREWAADTVGGEVSEGGRSKSMLAAK